MQKQAWLVVVGVLLTGIIGTSQSREIADETDFEAAMKDVGKNFGAVRSAMEAREGETVASGAENLVSIFEGVEAFFSARDLEHGVTVAGQALQAAADIKSAIDNETFGELVGARDRLGAACLSCHTEYREQLEEGGFRFKPGVL